MVRIMDGKVDMVEVLQDKVEQRTMYRGLHGEQLERVQRHLGEWQDIIILLMAVREHLGREVPDIM